MWTYEIDSVGQFMEYFLTVYSGKPSNADLIIVNAGLYRLFHECSAVETDPALKADYKAQSALCHQNLEPLLTRLPFILPCTLDYIMALSMGSQHYMDKGKPTLAWSIIAAAGHMCLSLDFHRDSPLEPESVETRRRRIRLFWAVCLSEKSLALRLGRPSTIRNSEITIPRVFDDCDEGGSSPVLQRWIDVALLQDRVYDDIYSPSALSLPEDVRIMRARNLAAEMQKTFEHGTPLERQWEASFREAIGSLAYDTFYYSEKVSYLAVLTLIYRSIPPSPYSGSAFSEECISTAIQALEEHEKCISRLHDHQNDNVLSLYIEWALLSAPFVPFIVIFCHVIETSNTVYLSKLASLVDLLKVATPNLPGAYGKQCSIFTLMYEVACKYVEARAAVVAAAAAAGTGSQQMHQTHQQMQHLVSAEEFDDLFGDAGLIGAQLRSPILRFSEAGSRQLQQQQRQGFGLDQGTGGEGDAATSGERTAGIENGINLGNWFDQNHQIFRMMDDADS
ncbi:putative fungal specific transcription protein [Eutypa lata UCREL1]|uniref:Putative fungal specific transcription protein n=1 Tax=Eutypa lata (strain UCR-EL1) TaxID=1287681 RepID=M7SZK1_EUTLA|nr:putative fungal specific transcription protein [Eutypa lata UCREL1]